VAELVLLVQVLTCDLSTCMAPSSPYVEGAPGRPKLLSRTWEASTEVGFLEHKGGTEVGLNLGWKCLLRLGIKTPIRPNSLGTWVANLNDPTANGYV
jgi:hypothetical protein